MTITTETVEDVVVATLSGDIDGKTAPDVQQQLVPMIEANSTLLLDMSGVSYMSSAGLRVMLLLYRQAASQDGSIALAGLSEDIQDVMSATGFLDFFTICSDVPEGVRKLKGAS
ncbi:MAG: STAS domain-containing protein [Deinococcota bacterium]